MASRLEQLNAGTRSITSWSPRRWVVAAVAGALAAVMIGVPTGVVPTSLYTRMTATTWWNYPVWSLTAALIGLISATYIGDPASGTLRRDLSRRTVGAGLLSVFAVGCPVCNTIVVGLLGAGGALTYWAPLQPVLGVLAVALLLTALAVRLREGAGCPTLRGA